MKASGRVLLALLLGLAAGLLARALDLSANRLAGFFEPIGILWSNAIRMTVIPLVIASIFGAVVQSRDFGAFGRMGSAVLMIAAALLALAAGLALTLGPVLLDQVPIDPEMLQRLRQGAGGATSGTTGLGVSFGEWLIQLIPANPFKTLADGSLLPLVVATISFAAAARGVPGPKRLTLVHVAEAVTDVSLRLISWVLVVAPLGIFALIFSLTLRTGEGMAVALIYYVLLTVALCALVASCLFALVAATKVVKVRAFARAALAPQLVGFSSRSSVAALPLMLAASEDELRLPEEISRAFLPFLVSIFRVTGSIVICVGIVFIAWLYGVTLRPDQLLTVGLVSLVLSIAMPGIPGGGVLTMAPVLTAVGLPASAIGVLLAVDAVSDMFRTATNVTAHLALSVVAARILDRTRCDR